MVQCMDALLLYFILYCWDWSVFRFCWKKRIWAVGCCNAICLSSILSTELAPCLEKRGLHKPPDCHTQAELRTKYRLQSRVSFFFKCWWNFLVNSMCRWNRIWFLTTPFIVLLVLPIAVYPCDLFSWPFLCMISPPCLLIKLRSVGIVHTKFQTSSVQPLFFKTVAVVAMSNDIYKNFSSP